MEVEGVFFAIFELVLYSRVRGSWIRDKVTLLR